MLLEDTRNERIVCASVKLQFSKGIGYAVGTSHGSIIGQIGFYREAYGCTTDYVRQDDQCFLAWSSLKGYFPVDRHQAYIIAKSIGQVKVANDSERLDSYNCDFDMHLYPRKDILFLEEGTN